MATLAFNDYDAFIAAAMNKQHNLATDAIKFALTNAAPNASTHTVLADITEIAAGNGYASGGSALSSQTSTQTGGTYSLVAGASVTFTASGGSIGPFRYIVAYNSTAVGGPLISFYDHGSSITLTDGDSYLLNINGATLISGTLS